MTVEEIMSSDKAFLSPTDIAPVLGCGPYSISLAARDHPEALGFPVTRVGNRTKIPRLAFLRFIGAIEAEKGEMS